jgi:tetratricopeptide (TPR) repeat protein
MKIASPKRDTSHLTANEALRSCQAALRLKDKGDYGGAQEVMRPLWGRVGGRPETNGLHPSIAAEVLQCAGILTGWIGSKNGIEKAQEVAKDLISEAITFYESLGDTKKIAAARAEIAYCYFREGGLDEARIMLIEALEKLTTPGNTRARALLKLTTVEWSASRYYVALRILTDNASLFQRVTNHTIKANYHNELAIVLRNLATSEKRDNYFRQAISEYEQADLHLKLVGNIIYRAEVKNNLGFLYFKLSRFKKAHEYLDQARRLTASIKDKIGVAQIDESQAQVLIAEGRLEQAEEVVRHAVRVLARSDHQCLLAEALTTHGIALARLGKREPAQFAFQRAIEVAHQVGALNKAGLAALSLIEELDDLPRDTSHAAFHRAAEWLADSQGDLMSRFTAAAKKVFAVLDRELAAEEATEELFNKPRDLQQEMLRHESALIKQALAKTNGRLTEAASQLNLSYQALAYIIEGRHKDLLKERSPIRRRAPKKQPAPRFESTSARQEILHKNGQR